MAKTIQTVDPDVIRDLVARVKQLERRVLGGLQPGEDPTRQAPDDVIVMTPAGGIVARDGTTCYGEDCAIYVVTDSDMSDGEFELTALVDGNSTPLTVMVYNISTDAVEGDKYVATARLKSGHRYVVVESCTEEAGY